MSEQTNREILIDVQANVRHIKEEIKKLDEDKQRQWDKLDSLSVSRGYLKGWMASLSVVLVWIIRKLV